MTAPQIQSALARTQDALTKLQTALTLLEKIPTATDERALHEDAIVKRFEVLFEYTWKLLKAGAEYQGIEAPGPRPAIQEAVHFGWIEDPDFWMVALDARNGSVHDYFGMPKDDYLVLIAKFADEVSRLTGILAQL